MVCWNVGIVAIMSIYGHYGFELFCTDFVGRELLLFGIYVIVGCFAGKSPGADFYVYSDKIWIPATLREYLQVTITSTREQLLSQTYLLPGNLQDTE